jgi:hypothetical protein
MSLDADAVDRGPGCLERLDKVNHRGGLGTCGVDVVVVDLRRAISTELTVWARMRT